MLRKGVLESALESWEPFEPKELSLELDFPNGLIGEDLTETLKIFYEGLNRALFSGDQNRLIKELKVEPDLTDIGRSRRIEAKCSGHTRRIMLKDAQMAGYRRLQLHDPDIDDPRIYFALYRYGQRDVAKAFREKPHTDLVEYLSENTKFLVGLPFDIIHTVHSLGYTENSIATRSYGTRGVPATNFSTVLFDAFLSNPEDAIRSINLNPNDYRIWRRTFSGDLSINGLTIKPFPMVLIKDSDKRHKKFVNSLRLEKT